MERKLGRFGKRTGQDADQYGQIEPVNAQMVGVSDQLGNGIGAGQMFDQKETDEHHDPPGAGDQQGLARAAARRWGIVFKADQQKRQKGGQLPEYKHHQQMIAQYQPQHGNEKGLQIGIEFPG